MNRTDRTERYEERCFWAGSGHRTYNNVCFRCRKVFKTNNNSPEITPCGCCGKSDMVTCIGWKTEAPRKNASNRKWKNFAKEIHFTKLET